MLDRILALGYKPVTVGECLGDPKENWYRSSSGNLFTSSTSAVTSATKTSATIAPTATTTDGQCGGGSGFMCTGSEFGDCCSQVRRVLARFVTKTYANHLNHRLAGVALELFTVVKDARLGSVNVVSTFLRVAVPLPLHHRLNQQRSRRMLPVEEPAV